MYSETVSGTEAMSFLEVMHSMKHAAQESGQPSCCGCDQQHDA